MLLGAAAMQLIWLIARSEAWHVCVDAAGADCGRRPLYRAAAIGYLGNLFNPSFGLAVRIAELRRTAPTTRPRRHPGRRGAADRGDRDRPRGDLLVHSRRPLDIPWWTPLGALALGVARSSGMSRLADRKRQGFWNGLAVLRGLRHRNTIIALTIFAVSAQVFRNWLVLNGVGVDVSVFDSMALLIATAALGLLPIGPGLTVATTVLILGSNGVAATAAAGALLTATGAVGALVFASWALADRFRTRNRPASRPGPSRPARRSGPCRSGSRSRRPCRRRRS